MRHKMGVWLSGRTRSAHLNSRWACGSVVERVPDKNEVEGPIPSTPTKNLNIP